MGTVYSSNDEKKDPIVIVKDKLTKYRIELNDKINLLKAHVESLKYTMSRHRDKETIRIITTNIDLSLLKIQLIERVNLQIDDIIFQIAIGINNEHLYELLVMLNEELTSSTKTVYIKKFEEMVVEIDKELISKFI